MPPPTVAELGTETRKRWRWVALLIVNCAGFETPPPGAGLYTVMVAVRGLVISLAGMFSHHVIRAPEIRFPVRTVPSDCGTGNKIGTVDVKGEARFPPPSQNRPGLRLLIVGVGLEMTEM